MSVMVRKTTCSYLLWNNIIHGNYLLLLLFIFNERIAPICPAISIAVKTMRRGEVAELAVKFLCKMFYFILFIYF